jgi:hypothetical protein
MQDSEEVLKEEISRLYNVPCFDPLKDDLSDVVAKIKSI